MIHSVVTDDHPDLVAAMGTLVPSFVVCTIKLLQQTMEHGLMYCQTLQPLLNRCRRLVRYFTCHAPLTGVLSQVNIKKGMNEGS